MSELRHTACEECPAEVAKEWAEVAVEFHETALASQGSEKGEPAMIRDAAKKPTIPAALPRVAGLISKCVTDKAAGQRRAPAVEQLCNQSTGRAPSTGQACCGRRDEHVSHHWLGR